MEQINVEELLDNGLSITGVENSQNEQNFNHPIGLLDYNDKISCQEKEILDIDEIETKIVRDCSCVNEIDVSSDTTDDDDIQSVNQPRSFNPTCGFHRFRYSVFIRIYQFHVVSYQI
jgi:hypothetical protein